MITGQLNELEKHIGPHDALVIENYIEAIKANPITGVWMTLDKELKGVALSKSGFKQGVFEHHEKYQDIHIVLEGKDQIHLGCPFEKVVITSYAADGDYALYNSKKIEQIDIYLFNLF